MATKKERIGEARQRLKTARDQWHRAAVASWEPIEPAECISHSFYAFENAVTAAVLAVGLKTTTKHYEKEALASQLVAQGKLKTDVSERLNELNSVRKDVQYGEAGASLIEIDLEDLVAELDEFLSEVEHLVNESEGI